MPRCIPDRARMWEAPLARNVCFVFGETSFFSAQSMALYRPGVNSSSKGMESMLMHIFSLQLRAAGEINSKTILPIAATRNPANATPRAP